MNSCKYDVGHGNDTDNFKEPLLLQPPYERSTSLLCAELRSFRISLRWWELDHSTWISNFVSYLTFAFLAVFVPIVSSLSIWLQILSSAFPMESTAFQVPPPGSIPRVDLGILGRFLRRYGLRQAGRQLFFVDALQENTTLVRWRRRSVTSHSYFFVEIVHKVIFFSTVKTPLPYVSEGFPLNSIVLVLGSWFYRTGVFLLVCVLFRLTSKIRRAT